MKSLRNPSTFDFDFSSLQLKIQLTIGKTKSKSWEQKRNFKFFPFGIFPFTLSTYPIQNTPFFLIKRNFFLGGGGLVGC